MIHTTLSSREELCPVVEATWMRLRSGREVLTNGHLSGRDAQVK